MPNGQNYFVLILWCTNLIQVYDVESHSRSGQDGRKSGDDVSHGVHFRRGRLLIGRVFDVPEKDHLRHISALGKMDSLTGSGCVSVGRAVASNTRDPRFESSHRQDFTLIIFTVN